MDGSYITLEIKALIGMEGGHAIDNSLAMLRMMNEPMGAHHGHAQPAAVATRH